MSDSLHVVVATPLSESNAALLLEREPRIRLEHRPELLADPTADWMVRLDRDADAQRAYEALLDGAEALFGVPDQSGTALGRTVAANPRLRWVHTIPAGGGAQVRAAKLDEDALDRIAFTTSAGVHAEPLSEFAVLGIFAGAKQLPRLEADRRDTRWGPRWPMGMVREQIIAVVGLGAIGRLTAHKLAGLGARVVGVHRREVDAPGVERIEPVERLAEALAEADAVVLALPGTDATKRILSREVLARVKPGITVVNVGRGTTIDEAALVEALADGRVGLAALDVTEVEPLPESSPLWTLPNVILSPHNAAISEHEPRLIAELFAENARRLLDGEPLLNRVNTREFY